jgi:prepilin-type processing-associated H-X9-DG protein
VTTTTDLPKRLGHMKQMSTTILILDSDQDPAQASLLLPENNWPDPGNNHGRAGLNMGFCDGHVTFIPRGKQLLKTYMSSYCDPAMSTAYMQALYPGITCAAGVVNGTSYSKIWHLPF